MNVNAPSVGGDPEDEDVQPVPPTVVVESEPVEDDDEEEEEDEEVEIEGGVEEEGEEGKS